MPDGRLLVSDEHGSAVMLDPRTGSVGRPLDGFGAPFTPSFSRDRRLMASAVAQGGGCRADAALRPPDRSPAHLRRVRRRRACRSARTGGRMAVVDRARRGHRRRRDVAAPATGSPAPGWRRPWCSSAPTGDSWPPAASSGWVRVWSTETWRPASSRVQAQTGAGASTSRSARTAGCSPPAATTARSSSSTSAPSRPFGTPLPALPNRWRPRSSRRDGAYLLAVTDGGRAYRWDLRPSVLGPPRVRRRRAAGSRGPNGTRSCPAGRTRRPADQSLADVLVPHLGVGRR